MRVTSHFVSVGSLRVSQDLLVPGALGDGTYPQAVNIQKSSGLTILFLDVYFGLMTITESVRPFPSFSVAEFMGSFSPIPSTRNL